VIIIAFIAIIDKIPCSVTISASAVPIFFIKKFFAEKK
jgi:hypothetical protein